MKQFFTKSKYKTRGGFPTTINMSTTCPFSLPPVLPCEGWVGWLRRWRWRWGAGLVRGWGCCWKLRLQYWKRQLLEPGAQVKKLQPLMTQKVYTVEPLLTTTSDEQPPCLLRILTLVTIASLFKIVLKKPLLRSHLSTLYNGQLLRPQMMLINTKLPLVTAHFLTAKNIYLTESAKNDHFAHILFTVRIKIASKGPNCRFSKNHAAI